MWYDLFKFFVKEMREDFQTTGRIIEKRNAS